MPFWGLARRPRPRKKNNRATSGLTGTKEKKQKKERKGDVHADYDSPHHCLPQTNNTKERERVEFSPHIRKTSAERDKRERRLFLFPFLPIGAGSSVSRHRGQKEAKKPPLSLVAANGGVSKIVHLSKSKLREVQLILLF